MNNPFLLSKHTLSKEWIATYDSLISYSIYFKYLPTENYLGRRSSLADEAIEQKGRERLESKFRNSFFQVIALMQHCQPYVFKDAHERKKS